MGKIQFDFLALALECINHNRKTMIDIDSFINVFPRTLSRKLRESVRAKLKVIIKRTLRQFGYSPDMQKLATETVLKQTEMIAEEMTNENL